MTFVEFFRAHWRRYLTSSIVTAATVAVHFLAAYFLFAAMGLSAYIASNGLSFTKEVGVGIALAALITATRATLKYIAERYILSRFPDLADPNLNQAGPLPPPASQPQR